MLGSVGVVSGLVEGGGWWVMVQGENWCVCLLVLFIFGSQVRVECFDGLILEVFCFDYLVEIVRSILL